jgi:hypothetical protein
VLSKDCFKIEERLAPMFEEALKTQTFGLAITCWSFITVPSVPTEIGPRPGWGIYFQAKGQLLDQQDAQAQLSLVMSPLVSQETIDEAVREGAAELRENFAKANIQRNGKGIK